jgi:hypothetical protein
MRLLLLIHALALVVAAQTSDLRVASQLLGGLQWRSIGPARTTGEAECALARGQLAADQLSGFSLVQQVFSVPHLSVQQKTLGQKNLPEPGGLC